MKKQEFDVKFYQKTRKVVSCVFTSLYLPKVEGIENIPHESGFILAGNHKSLLDIPFVATTVDHPVRFMGKKELFENAITNYYFTKLGAFSVERESIDLNAVKTAMKLLKQQEVLGIFPEGTRNRGEGLLPFKEGTARIAIKTKTPIIPFGISGEYKLRGGITIRFGEAIDFNKIQVEDENEYLKSKVKELICDK